MGQELLKIHKDRINDDIYGTGQLDNRWELNEIDDILNSVKGSWQIDEYIGFVYPSLYYSGLDWRDNLGQAEKERLNEAYEEKVRKAKTNIPDVSFSIKEYNDEETNSNYIFVNGRYRSPISIILSVDRLNHNYPIYKDQTTISADFHVEYPVIYVKFFINFFEESQTIRYEPATLVISSDNKFYILIDGAFYSLKKS